MYDEAFNKVLEEIAILSTKLNPYTLSDEQLETLGNIHQAILNYKVRNNT